MKNFFTEAISLLREIAKETRDPVNSESLLGLARDLQPFARERRELRERIATACLPMAIAEVTREALDPDAAANAAVVMADALIKRLEQP